MGESAQQSRSDVLRVSRRCQKTPPAPHPWLWNLLVLLARIEQERERERRFYERKYTRFSLKASIWMES